MTTAKLGEELTVVVRVRSTDNQMLANVAIEDLLPGGFEIVEESVQTGACSGWGEIRVHRCARGPLAGLRHGDGRGHGDHVPHQGDEPGDLRDSAGAGGGDVSPEDPRARRFGNADGGLMNAIRLIRRMGRIGPILRRRNICGSVGRLFAVVIAAVPKPHLLDEASFSPCYVDRNGSC